MSTLASVIIGLVIVAIFIVCGAAMFVIADKFYQDEHEDVDQSRG